MKLTTDKEFASLNPPLAPEEEAALVDSLKSEGCRDPIDVWRGLIVDGHNRHRLCTEHKIRFEVREHQFASREEALRWACTVQAGRRNATPEHRAYLIGKIYNSQVQEHGGDHGNQHTKVARCNRCTLPNGEDAKAKTAEKLAQAHGVAPRTVYNSADFAEAVDAIGEVAPEAKAAILSGEVKGTRKQIEQLSELPKRERKKAAKAIAAGAPVAEAIAEVVAEPSEAEKPAAIKDENGLPVPERCQSLWMLRQELLRVHRSISEDLGIIEFVAGRANDALYLDGIIGSLKNARQAINNAKPYAVCPYCQGTGKLNGKVCDCCKGCGLVTRAQYTQAPAELRG